MSTNNKHKISEKELDNLLGQAFLNLDYTNPKNQKLMETISTQHLSNYNVFTYYLKNFINSKYIIALIAAIAIIIPTIILYPKKQVKSDITTTQQTINNDVVVFQKKAESNFKLPDIKKESALIQKSIISETITLKQDKSLIAVTSSNEEPFNTNKQNEIVFEKNNGEEDSSYIFPTLTEKEIKANNKSKSIIVAFSAGRNMKNYAKIPKGTFKYKDKFVSVSDFYISTNEVTNLEYRTFLFDLLINGKKKEFLRAKPYQKLWEDYISDDTYAKFMKDNYFSNRKYDEYPVVNISIEGAEMYCEWLTEETNKYLSSKNKPLVNDFRVPTITEWTYAALGGTDSLYAFNKNTIQNSKGCFLGNFNIKKKTEQLNFNCPYTKFKNAITSAGLMIGEDIFPCQIWSYNPNIYGLYNMSGNVAEFVYEQDVNLNKLKSIDSRGGSWYCDFEQLKINSESDFNTKGKPAPMNGFRYVTSINQTASFGSIERDILETGLQKLTDEEAVVFQKEKKKMIELLAKVNKNKYANISRGSFLYKKDTISVQPFYIQTTEVTNFEYRIFLADLLLQNRNEDYLLSKPNQHMWVSKFPNDFNEPMKDTYFCHLAYDEYPVVNISRKGAELYCLWLTTETNNYLKANKQPLVNNLRIPMDIEWAYAASNGKNKVKYANGHDYLKDTKGSYEMNYMCYSKEQCRYDSIMRLYVPKNKEELKQNNLPKLIDDGGFHTVHTKSYTPNNYGLYCMAGNVSEMVNNFDLKTKENKAKGTKGGSWFSCDYFLEIDADEEYSREEGPSPLIGFRPVMTVLKTK